jgi:hypothetical protein
MDQRTAEVVAAMLTENTGRHMLDSGGAYGRHWERNQGRDVQDWINSSTAAWGWKGEYYTLNLFHWLVERLEYAPELDAELDKFAAARPDDGWLDIMDEFCEQTWPELSRECINSYNGEEALSQVIQFTGVFDHDYPDFQYVLLQIHGGCDVRGGYTAPRVFEVVGDECCMYDFMSASFYCDGFDPPQFETLPGFPTPTRTQHHWLVTGGGELIDQYGSYVESTWEFLNGQDIWDEDADRVLCPECLSSGHKTTLHVSG